MSETFYADSSTGVLYTTNEAGTTQVTFTYTTSAGAATITGFTPKTYAGALVTPLTLGGEPVTSIGNNAFASCTSLTSITIPDSVTTIGDAAFQSCGSLTSITISDSVTTIGSNAFRTCESLTSITIPASVTTIGNQAFFGCTSLPNIVVDSNNANYASVDGILYNKDQTFLIVCPAGKVGDVTISALTTTIGDSSFGGCSQVTAITISASVTTIQDYALSGTTITSITIPASVTTIGEYAFYSSRLITVYVYESNALNLTEATSVSFYGTESVNIEYAEGGPPGEPPLSPICFPAGTKVTTDQGDIAIEKLKPDLHTIRGRKIVAITKTTTLQKHIISIEKDALARNVPSVTTQISKEHKLFYKGKMVKARDLLDVCQGVTTMPYNGEMLYNVLLKKHDKMMINNLICETLHPGNIVGQIYNKKLSPQQMNEISALLNRIIRKNDTPAFKEFCASLR